MGASAWLALGLIGTGALGLILVGDDVPAAPPPTTLRTLAEQRRASASSAA